MSRLVMVIVFCFLLGSCKEQWSGSDKRRFYTACAETARKDWAETDSIATKYCDCLFEKMAMKYPNEQDMMEHIAELAKDTDLINCKAEVTGKK